MAKSYIIPVFIPYKKDYIFENIQSKNWKITKEETRKTIEEHLKEIEENSNIEIAFLGGDFTQLEEENQNELLEIAYEYLKEKKVNRIKVSVKPNNINKNFLKRLKKFKVKTIELEIKSVNDYILKTVEEEYSLEDIKKASKLIKFRGFKLEYKTIIGVPESTHLDEINTAKQIIKLRPKKVKVCPVIIMKNTRIEKDYNNKIYKPLTEVQAIETCKEVIKLYAKKDIEITGVGIQPEEVMATPEEFSKEFVKGPFNVKLKQLVESGMWYDVIVEKIKKLNSKVKEVIVTINPIDLENVIGENESNIQNLKNLYDVDLIAKGSEKIKQGKSKIEITKIY